MSQKPSESALPPCTIEGEEAVLGSILINEEALEWIMGMIKPESFFLARHAFIYQAMLDLHSRQEQIDNLTLAYELQARKQLDDVGGHAYISRLINNTPTHTNAKIYAAMIEETYRRRRILDFAGDLARTALEGENSTEALSQIDTAKKFLEDRHQVKDDPYLIHVSQLKNLPAISWLLPNEIPERSLVMYFGASGVGKSFVALDRALQIAEGLPVVYVAAEGQSTFWARSEAWAKHHNRQTENSYMHFYLKTVSLIEDDERRRFMSTVEKIKPALVVIDTVAHCIMPGNENDTRDMGLFIRGAQDLQSKFGCSILFVHHTSKAGLRERGSTSLYNSCDLVMRISDQDDQIALECMKSKSTEALPTKYMKMLPVEVEEGEFNVVVIDSERVIQSKGDPLTRSQRKVLETFSMEAYAAGLTRTELIELTEIGNGSMGRILSTLIRFGYIQQAYSRDKYTLVSRDSNESDESQDSQDSHDSQDRESVLSNENKKQGGLPSLPIQESHSKVIQFGAVAPKTPCPNCKTMNWAWSGKKWFCSNCESKRVKDKDLRIYLTGIAHKDSKQ